MRKEKEWPTKGKYKKKTGITKVYRYLMKYAVCPLTRLVIMQPIRPRAKLVTIGLEVEASLRHKERRKVIARAL
jgi:hypothetical protein